MGASAAERVRSPAVTIPSVSTDEGTGWLDGPMPGGGGAVRQVFSAEIAGLPRLYGLWRPKWEENGTDFAIEVTDFGWEHKAELETLEEPSRRRVWLKQAAAVRKVVGRLFQECAETGALTVLGHPDAKYVGDIQFVQGWVGLLSRPQKPPTTIVTEAGVARMVGLVRCWDEQGRDCFSLELAGQPPAFGEWEEVWHDGGPKFDVLITGFGWREKMGIGLSAPPGRISYSQAQADDLRGLALALFRAEAEAQTVSSFSRETPEFTGRIEIAEAWLIVSGC